MAKQGVKRQGRQPVEDVNRNSRPADLAVMQSLVTELLLALDERFEAGAVDEDEYRARRAAMKSHLIARTRQTVSAS